MVQNQVVIYKNLCLLTANMGASVQKIGKTLAKIIIFSIYFSPTPKLVFLVPRWRCVGKLIHNFSCHTAHYNDTPISVYLTHGSGHIWYFKVIW